jgi:ubiquitin-protein ligase
LSLDVPRLKSEYKKLQELEADSELIKVKPKKFVAEDAPIEYEIEYFCKGLCKDHKSGKVYVSDPQVNGRPHILSIVLPAEFPIFGPKLIFKTGIFHPNINDPTAPSKNFQRIPPGHVCYAAWRPERNLRSLVLEVGEMIQYKRYGMLEKNRFDILPTPICEEALKYLKKNLLNMPIDPRKLTNKIKIELEEPQEPGIEILDIGEEEGPRVIEMKTIKSETKEIKHSKGPSIIEAIDTSDESNKEER